MVQSEPLSAEIYLDGDNIGVTPAIITQILPGRYKVKIKMEGYAVWNQSVDVKENKETSIKATLQGKDGSIAVTSEPSDAEVFLDGNSVGTTPETIADVKPGKHKIELKLNKYETWSREIDVGAAEEVSITAELVLEYGSITLDSEPANAKIFLDNIEVATTPANLKSVPHGTHSVEVRKDGYSAWKKSVTVVSGKEEVLTARLQIKTGSINVKSEPKSAKIFLDGKHVGTTPEEILSISPGTHEIQVKMDGFDVWSETVNIEAGKENSITAKLQRSTGSLMIESKPADAVIFFDGKEIGTTPEIVMSGSKGTHTVEIKLDGYETWKKSVDIKPGTEESLTAILQIRTGSLNINSTPPGGTIFIDGIESGTTPGKIENMKSGTRKVEVKIEGYESWTESIDIAVDQEKHMTAVLKHLTGTLNISSEPEKAVIVIDGNEAGNTPANITGLKPGKHLVEVKMEGYEKWSESVDIQHSKETDLKAVLQVIPGSLSINSTPPGGTIFVDGIESGTTPDKIENMKSGTRKVEVRMEGYESWTDNIDIAVDQEKHLTAVLKLLTGSLNIRSEPEKAVIVLNGNEAGNTPANITGLKPGKHLVEVKMEGYEKWSESVDIEHSKETDLKAALQIIPGSLCIYSEPIDASIFIDTKEAGKTPLTIKNPDPGKHSIEVRMEGYETWSETVNIVPGKRSELTATLQIRPSTVGIQSEPSNAKIIVDGKEIGNTPSSLSDLEPGMHQVEVKIEGYESWSQEIKVEPGKKINLTASLITKAGSVCIKSNPSNAIVLVEGKKAGLTPLTITDQEPGKHVVELRMDGYITWKDSIDFESGKDITITRDLQMKAGAISINSNPSEATIYIDGKSTGKTPKTITDLQPATHLVEVKMDGYETWSESVEVKGDKENSLTADLQKITGSVNIISVPSDATIYLDGEETGTFPDTLKSISIGVHEVEVKKDGFAEWKKTINIKRGKEITLNAVLQPNTGTVSIASEPSEATTLLDGNEIGKTPVNKAGIKIGTHEVQIQKDGYLSWKNTIKIKAAKTSSLTAKLVEMTGSINVSSTPSDAVIHIDGKKRGNTPATITDLSKGKHMVEINMDRYEMWCESINVDPGKEVAVTAELQMNPASISITSNPPGAMIYMDGKEAGTTPKVITDLTIEKHLLEVKMDGYEVWNKSIDTEPGIGLTLTADLQMKAGSVSINSEPPDAMIFIDGKKAGITPETLTDIKPGNHSVEVRMEGYETWSESVKVSGDKENVLTAKLKKIAGSLSITSSPSDAIVYLNGEEAGTTPYSLQSATIGTHEVEVKSDLHAEWKKKINIKKGKETTLNAVLQPITGTIILESDPEEAMILLDGKEIGKTPETITGIKTGLHEVEVQKNGCISWNKTIKIKAGRKHAFKATLERRKGSLMIISNPSDARIFIEGKKAGRTPEAIAELKSGKYSVEIKLEGYQIWSEDAEVIPGEETIVKAVLQEKPGSIIIKSKPSDAKIFIDGRETGTTPETISDLESGAHIVELKLDGYDVWSESVEVKSSRESYLTAVLRGEGGSIRIESEPSNATILIDGNEYGETPATIDNLSSGTHTVDISIDGYNTWREKVEVEPKQKSELKAILQEVKGTVTINSMPADASIFIDGQKAGTTPETIADIIGGTHLVEIRMDGYEVWSESINVVSDKEYTITASLKELTGSINIKSEPEHATILIDGNNAGTTPETIKNLNPGLHQAEVFLEGFEIWSKSIEVTAGKESSIVASLQKATGSINITSTPSNTRIYLDGKEAGTTPATLNSVPVGAHEIEIKARGHEEWKKSIIVKKDKEISLNAALQVNIGSISIESVPENAKIILDGNNIGTAPERLTDITVGTHEVEIVLDGYVTWKKTIKVKAEKDISLTADLEKVSDTLEIKNDKESTLAALPQQATGSISITSTPSNTKIYLDGEEAGTTPATLSSVPVGTHEVEIRTGGHEVWKKSINIKKDKEISLNAALQVNIGSISIESDPENAKIILDGNNVGTTPKRLTDITVGTHEVEIVLDGYVTWKKTIKVKAEKDISLTADLEKISDTSKIKAEQAIKSAETVEPTAPKTPVIKPKPEKVVEKPISRPAGAEPSPADKKTKYSPDKLIKLRSTYERISDSQVETLPYITINEKNNDIFLCHSSINHRYELKPIGDGEVVIDHTTELMWHQSGSSEYFSLRKANKWLKKTNKNGYAGFTDWRLPTLEEAATLLEFGAKNEKFIHTIFDDKQWGTWTGDKSDRGLIWIVTYVNGTISQVQAGTPATFVRPVRSLNP